MAALLAYAADRTLFKSRPGDDTRVNALIDLDGVLDFTTPLALQYENAAGTIRRQRPSGSAAPWKWQLSGGMKPARRAMWARYQHPL